ncbi:DNA-binding PadR family transcriptional regulator [Mycolicibacterium sp. BK556]|uniref:PadR family transcriptional regulator n=1 Tax=Mycobacteriaceae TaxID=1762 RepID=UPI00105D5A61|nr:MULTISPECIES: PadR family transcriptional regulator [Mycobacteriaceae]MBB3600389.1 DNA-binding PadR family transcriptional regulator [Mycolicibacterium sp. BK556]MBB3630141.1 DNA-binding PadR family transcriptional regulator [Mycolicibacterium sp. BK607]MBB3748139.1 DNA-binding PadR family transcriptional regulator [Mycolicibacterium sp. BK634]TDO09956.1 DNA-binding PadR family transcriptional regulator [Mycobacterium sp. BK086]
MTEVRPAEDEYPSLTANGWTVLGIVSYSNELTGYQLKKWADFGPGFFYLHPSFSQVYSELKRLEEMGLVASREDTTDESKSRSKRLYRITESGRQALRSWSRNAPVEMPVLKHPMLMRVMLGNFNARENLEQMLTEYIERSDLQSRQAAHYAQVAASDPFFAYVWISLRWAERYYAAERTLAQELLKDLDLAVARFKDTGTVPDWFQAPPLSGELDGEPDAPPNRGRPR